MPKNLNPIPPIPLETRKEYILDNIETSARKFVEEQWELRYNLLKDQEYVPDIIFWKSFILDALANDKNIELSTEEDFKTFSNTLEKYATPFLFSYEQKPKYKKGYEKANDHKDKEMYRIAKRLKYEKWHRNQYNKECELAREFSYLKSVNRIMLLTAYIKSQKYSANLVSVKDFSGQLKKLFLTVDDLMYCLDALLLIYVQFTTEYSSFLDFSNKMIRKANSLGVRPSVLIKSLKKSGGYYDYAQSLESLEDAACRLNKALGRNIKLSVYMRFFSYDSSSRTIEGSIRDIKKLSVENFEEVLKQRLYITSSIYI